MFYNHHRSIWHIDPDLDHSRGNQNLNLAGDKAFHYFIFLGRLHLSVNQPDAILRKHDIP